MFPPSIERLLVAPGFIRARGSSACRECGERLSDQYRRIGARVERLPSATQARSNSLMLVFERVWASTRLTITAQ